MFTREISGLTLTKDVADGLFRNITGDKFYGDETFVATLRALLHNRIPGGESVRFQFTKSSHNADAISRATPKDVVRAFLRGSRIPDGVNGTLLVHSFEGLDDDNAAALKVIEENGLAGAVDGYTALDDVAVFFKQQGRINVKVLVNETCKSTIKEPCIQRAKMPCLGTPEKCKILQNLRTFFEINVSGRY